MCRDDTARGLHFYVNYFPRFRMGTQTLPQTFLEPSRTTEEYSEAQSQGDEEEEENFVPDDEQIDGVEIETKDANGVESMQVPSDRVQQQQDEEKTEKKEGVQTAAAAVAVEVGVGVTTTGDQEIGNVNTETQSGSERKYSL